MELVAVVARSIWLRGNALVFGRKVSPPNLIISKALESLEAFLNANSRPYIETAVDNTRATRWQAPLEGFVKIN